MAPTFVKIDCEVSALRTFPSTLSPFPTCSTNGQFSLVLPRNPFIFPARKLTFIEQGFSSPEFAVAACKFFVLRSCVSFSFHRWVIYAVSVLGSTIVDWRSNFIVRVCSRVSTAVSDAKSLFDEGRRYDILSVVISNGKIYSNVGGNVRFKRNFVLSDSSTIRLRSRRVYKIVSTSLCRQMSRPNRMTQ